MPLCKPGTKPTWVIYVFIWETKRVQVCGTICDSLFTWEPLGFLESSLHVFFFFYLCKVFCISFLLKNKVHEWYMTDYNYKTDEHSAVVTSQNLIDRNVQRINRGFVDTDFELWSIYTLLGFLIIAWNTAKYSRSFGCIRFHIIPRYMYVHKIYRCRYYVVCASYRESARKFRDTFSRSRTRRSSRVAFFWNIVANHFECTQGHRSMGN